MVSTMAWNDNANMLAAVADNKVTFWYYPSVAFVDPDIIPKTLLQKDEKYVTAVFLLLKLLIFHSKVKFDLVKIWSSIWSNNRPCSYSAKEPGSSVIFIHFYTRDSIERR